MSATRYLRYPQGSVMTTQGRSTASFSPSFDPDFFTMQTNGFLSNSPWHFFPVHSRKNVPAAWQIREKMVYFAPGFDPGAAVTTLSASTSSGRISAGMPMTISPSSISENFRDPSQPNEKFTFPFR